MSNPVTPLTPEEYKQEQTSEPKESWFHRAAVAVDIAANVLVFDGQQDETMSSHAARLAVEKRSGVRHEVGVIVSEGLDLIEKNHGAKAIAADELRGLNVAKTEESSGILPK